MRNGTPRPGRLLLATFVGALALVAACHDVNAPPPRPAAPTRDLGPSYSATFPVGSAATPANSMSLGSFPEARVVRIKVSGFLTKVHVPDASQNVRFGPHGYQQCYFGSVSVTFSGTGQAMGPLCYPGLESVETNERLVRVQGLGTVTRGGGQSTTCSDGSPGCWRYEGSQQVTIEPVDFSATLWSWAGAPVNNYSTYLASPGYLWFNWLPEPSAPSNTPKQTFEWWWIDADDGQRWDLPTKYGYNNWPMWVNNSGTMYVKVKLNGVEKTLERYIHVGPPALALSARPKPVLFGDTVTFEARVLPDSSVSVSDISWWWFPSPVSTIALRASVTTAGTPSSDVMARSSLASTAPPDSFQVCHGRGLTCTYEPGTDGRMRIHATLAGVPKHADASITLEEGIKVVCETPTRGQEATCTASAVPQGATLRIDGWNFATTEPGIQFTLDRTDDPSALTWKGVVVAKGTVTARGAVNGQPKAGSSSLDWLPRTFAGTVAYTIDEIEPSGLPDQPKEAADGQFGLTDFAARLSTTGRGSRGVPDGPNEGLNYFDDLPFQVAVEVRINREALTANSTFWYWQGFERTGSIGTPWCARSDIPRWLDLVIAHEGLTRNAPFSHTKVYLDEFERLANQQIEPLVSPGGINVESLLASLHAAAYAESKRVTHGADDPLKTMPCRFKYSA